MSIDVAERLAGLTSKLEQLQSSIETEEATKTALVMPFISMVLGYDVFDPSEVVPEFTADVGTKKGEKVDYAIVSDQQVQIIFECKRLGTNLNVNHASQLFRYFAVTNARIAVLTNGDEYQFFTDLDAPNVMDEKPFLIIRISDLDSALIPEIKKLSKDSFDLESIVSSAEELKYVGEIKRILSAQFNSPDADWVKLLASRVYSGSITQRVRDQFGVLIQKAGQQFLNDRVNDRLKAAMGTRVEPEPQSVELADSENDEGPVNTGTESGSRSGIETTLEELEAFHIVRAIACSEVPASRIFMRDTKTYLGVLLDDNNRKPIVRLWFNSSKKYIGLFDGQKNETRYPISDLAEIYSFAEHIRASVHFYEI